MKLKSKYKDHIQLGKEVIYIERNDSTGFFSGSLDYDSFKYYSPKDIPENLKLKISDINKCFTVEYGNICIDSIKIFNNNVYIRYDVAFNLEDWNRDLNVLSYKDLFITSFKKEFEVLEIELNPDDGDLIIYECCVQIYNIKSLKKILKNNKKIIIKIGKSILNNYESITTIVKESYIPEKFQSPAASLMHYFSVIMNQKRPDIDISISVENSSKDNLIKVSLNCRKEHRETVNGIFVQYGEVISGKISPEIFLPDYEHASLLNSKLISVKKELSHSKELLQSADSKIEILEKNLRVLTAKDEQLREMLHKLENQSSHATMNKLLDILATTIEQRDSKKIPEVLYTIQKNDPSLFTKLNEVFVLGAISGVSGNLVYKWILPFIENSPIK